MQLDGIEVSETVLDVCHGVTGQCPETVHISKSVVVSKALKLMAEALIKKGTFIYDAAIDRYVLAGENDRKPSVLSETVVAAIEAENAKDCKLLNSASNIGVIDRQSSDTKPPVPVAPPWERTMMLAVSPELEKDLTYLSAPNELFQMAVRTVYAHLPMHKWTTEESTALVMQTYKIFMEWGHQGA